MSTMEPFTLTPGPTIDLPDSGRAIDFFALFFTERIISEIVEFTNKNAQKKGAKNWKPVKAEELKAFLAMLIISNDIIVVPTRSTTSSHLQKQGYFIFQE